MIVNLFSYRPIKRRNYKGKVYYKWTLVYDIEFLKFKKESEKNEGINN